MDIEKLKENDFLIKSVRKNLSYNENDESNDDQIANMSKGEILERFLSWNNISGYSREILETYDVLSKSLEDDLVNFEHLSANETSGIIETLRKRGRFPDFDDPDFNEDAFVMYVNKMSLRDALEEYLSWKGIIGYSHTILKVIKTLEEAE